MLYLNKKQMENIISSRHLNVISFHVNQNHILYKKGNVSEGKKIAS